MDNELYNSMLVNVFESPSVSSTIESLAEEKGVSVDAVLETIVSQHFIEMDDSLKASYARLHSIVDTEVFFSYYRNYATVGVVSIMAGTGKSVNIDVFVLLSIEAERLQKAAQQSLDASVDLGFAVFFFSDDGVIKWR